MKVTITREDWSPDVNYTNPCGCLLARAMRRQTGKEWSVAPGTVDLKRGYGIVPDFSYDYNEKRGGRRLEELLDDAHENPDLLPITIELKEEST